jgi:hypothetical protein
MNSVEFYQQFVDTEDDNDAEEDNTEFIEDENDEPTEDGDNTGS